MHSLFQLNQGHPSNSVVAVDDKLLDLADSGTGTLIGGSLAVNCIGEGSRLERGHDWHA